MSTLVGPSVLDTALCIPDLRPRRKESALQELVNRAHRAGVVREPVLLCEALSLRERLGTTAIGKMAAVPNARSLAVVEPRLVFARSLRGLDWKAADGLPIHLVFLVLSPGDLSLEAHHEAVARVAGVARQQRNRQKLLAAASTEALAGLLREVMG